MEKIAITGATGKTGFSLTKLLSSQGFKVRAMLHSINNNPFEGQDNIEAVAADFNNESSLNSFFKGTSKAFLVVPPMPDMSNTFTKLAKSAIKNGVVQIVKLSAAGTDLSSKVSLLQQHAQAEESIATMSVKWTFVRPTMFFENLLNDIPTIQKRSAIYSPFGNTALAPISVHDIARAVSILLTETGHAGKTYTLTGPESFTYSQYARALSERLNQDIIYYNVPFDAVFEKLVLNGIPRWLASDLITLYQQWSETKGKKTTSDLEDITGDKGIGLTQFLEQNLDKYRTLKINPKTTV